MHCPATLLLTATPEGEGGVPALVERLAGEMVLAVVTAPGDARGAAVAAALDVPLEQEHGLEEGEPPSTLLGAIADLHRGETVLVLAGATEDTDAAVRRIELGEAF